MDKDEGWETSPQARSVRQADKGVEQRTSVWRHDKVVINHSA